MNRHQEIARITAELLAAKAPRVRLILWEKYHGIESIIDLSEFCNDPTNQHYKPLKIDKGRKLASYARHHIEQMVGTMETLPGGYITVEEVEEN